MPSYAHPSLGFTLEVPAGLEIVDTLPTVALLALEPDPGAGEPSYPARLTVAVDDRRMPEEEADFAEQSLTLQLRELAGARLIDSETADLGGVRATRTLIHLRDGSYPVCLEQWHLVHEGRGYTVGAAWGTLELPPLVASLRAGALSFRPGAPGERSRAEPAFDPSLGLLLVDDAGLQELSVGEGSAHLERAGALLDGAPHPTLAPALEVMRAPVCLVDIDVGGGQGRAWCGPGGTALALPPRPEEAPRRRLISLPTAFLPDALARLIDLGPRSRPSRASSASFSAAVLATLLAAAPSTELPFRGGVRRHWRMESRWEPGPGAAPGRAVEVLDTDDGLWRVVAGRDEVQLLPTDPTDVWHGLEGLLPRREEVVA